MNTAEALRSSLALFSSHPLLQRLFFASVEFAVLALLVFVAIHVGRLRSPRLAALLWLVVLAKPIVSLAVGSPLPLFRMEIPQSAAVAPAPLDAVVSTIPSEPVAQPLPVVAQPNQSRDERMVASSTANVPRVEADTSTSPPVESASPAAVAQPIEPSTRWNVATILLTIWLTGVAFFASLSLLDRLRVRWLVRHAQSPDSRLTERYLAIVAQLGLKRPLALRITDRVEGPALVGTFFNTILIPAWLTENARDGKLDWALRHELMHWKLRDPLAGLVRELALILFYFHPVAWWAGRQWKAAVERACDRAIVTCDADSLDYAEQLYRILVGIHGRSQFPLRTGLFATRTQIGQRIAALLNGPRTAPHLSALAIIGLTAVTAVALTVGGAFAAKEKESNHEDSKKTALAGSEPEPSTAKPIKAASVSDHRSELEKTAVPDETLTFAGTVVDEKGQPVPDAKISLSDFRKNWSADSAGPTAMTNIQGQFSFSQTLADFTRSRVDSPYWVDPGLMATKNGYGFAFGLAALFETTGRLHLKLTNYHQPWVEQSAGKKPNVLTLVRDDVPIRGRLLDVDGRPIAGARVELVSAIAGKDGTLDAWEKTLKTTDNDLNAAWRYLRILFEGYVGARGYNWSGTKASILIRMYQEPQFWYGKRASFAEPARSDADGRFTLRGLGRERIAEIVVSGPHLETTQRFVRSRPGDVIKMRVRSAAGDGYEPIYPSEFTLVVAPSRPVEGRVTDFKTGRPLAGVHVRSTGSLYVGSVTGADGKYGLEGLPLGRSAVSVMPPAGSRQIAGGVSLNLEPGSQPINRDIRLTEGIPVHGRTANERTGKPVPGQLRYFASRANPHVKESDSLARFSFHANFRPDGDGRFEIPVLPGQGILAFDAGQQFPYGVGADGITFARPKGSGQSNWIETAPSDCYTGGQNLLVPIDPKPDDTVVNVDLKLRSGTDIPGRALSPEGQPLTDYFVAGATGNPPWSMSKGEEFNVIGYFPSEKRRLTLYHPGRNLAAIYDLAGQPPAKLEIRLQPAATLVGRILDADGKPMKNVTVMNNMPRMVSFKGNLLDQDRERGVIPFGGYGLVFTTDAEGRFELKGIVPDLKYTATVIGPKQEGKFLMTSRLGVIFTDITAKPSEIKQLGDLRIKADQTRSNNRRKTAGAAEGKSKKDEATFQLAGRVLKPNGDSAVGATVHVEAFRGQFVGGSGEWTLIDSLPTDSQGRFARSFDPIWKPSESVNLRLTATLAGYGIANPVHPWKRDLQSAMLRLVEDEPIRGRLLNLEGRPIAGIRVDVAMLCNSQKEWIDRWLAKLPHDAIFSGIGGSVNEMRADGQKAPSFPSDSMYMPASTIPYAKTDAEGRFEMRGLGGQRLVLLKFVGPGIAAMKQYFLTRPSKPIPIQLGSVRGRSQVLSIYGSQFEYVAAPGTSVAGVVQDEETKKPIAGAIVASERWEGIPQSAGGNLSATTDAQGRYQLDGLPISDRNAITVTVPNSPYVPTDRIAIPKSRALEPVRLDVALRRGVWAVGRAYNVKTGQPVAATLFYTPYRSNEFAKRQRRSDRTNFLDYLPSGQTDKDGRFRVPIMPGRGVVALRCYGDYVPGYGAAKFKDLSDPKVEVATFDTLTPHRFDALTEVDPEPPTAEVHIDLPVDPGQDIVLKFVDRAGKRLAGVQVEGLHPMHSGRTESDSITVPATSVDETREMWFQHKQTGLCKFVHFRPMPGEKKRMITLEPPAVVTGRLVSPAGEPLGDVGISCFYHVAYNMFGQIPGVKTDANGRFRQELPGGGSFRLSPPFAPRDKYLTVESGQQIDLGELVNGRAKSSNQIPKPPDKPATRKPDPSRTR